MKPLFSSLAVLLFLIVPVAADADAADVSYSAKLNGIECADCKRTISRAIGKIKGVKTIRIAKEGENQHRLTIVTDGKNPISQSDATAALGKDSHYSIASWSKN